MLSISVGPHGVSAVLSGHVVTVELVLSVASGIKLVIASGNNFSVPSGSDSFGCSVPFVAPHYQLVHLVVVVLWIHLS